MKNQRIRKITLCAIMIALSTVLSLVPTIKAPLGGSITVGSMVPVMLVSILYGIKWGLPIAFGYSLIQLLLDLSVIASWGLSAGVFVGCMVFDYILAFSVLCTAGVFGTEKLRNVIFGTVTAGMLRYLCHMISGYLFFGSWAGEGFSPLTWTIVYNGAFMIPDTVICVIILCALYRFIPTLKKESEKE